MGDNRNEAFEPLSPSLSLIKVIATKNYTYRTYAVRLYSETQRPIQLKRETVVDTINRVNNE